MINKLKGAVWPWLLCASGFSINQLFAYLQYLKPPCLSSLTAFKQIIQRVNAATLHPVVSSCHGSFAPFLCPPLCGLFFGQLLNDDLCPWVIGVKCPVRVAFFDLTVVDVHNPLQQIQNQAFIQVRTA